DRPSLHDALPICFTAWPGSAGVVAGLERDDSGETPGVGEVGERVDFRVRRAGPAMPSLGDDAADVVEQNAPDLRVSARHRTACGQFEGTTHGGVVGDQ